jgi:hypothetical protein
VKLASARSRRSALLRPRCARLTALIVQLSRGQRAGRVAPKDDVRPPFNGRLISQAERSQVVVVSHAPTLVDALQQLPECHSIALEKEFGQTVLVVDDEQPT